MRLRKHLTYANVVATVALFGVVAGGGAYAASKIGSSDIKRKAVTESKLANHAVSAKKIADGAVGDAQVSSTASGVAALGVTYDTGLVANYFNRIGEGPPRVEHTATGTYAIYFPGVDFAHLPNFVEVATGLNGGTASVTLDSCSGYCPPLHPVVTVRDSSGSPRDQAFSYVAYQGQDQTAQP